MIEISPQIGLVDADGVGIQTVFVDPFVVIARCMHRGVGHCLVVRKRVGCHIFLAHLEHLVELCWAPRPVEFQMWNWCYSSHACKLANNSMQLPPCGMYLLTFDKFHWVAASDGREFIDCIQFLWGLNQNCWRSTLLREDDDRSACSSNQEYSICFRSIMYAYKKLLLHRWYTLVHSLKLSSHHHL